MANAEGMKAPGGDCSCLEISGGESCLADGGGESCLALGGGDLVAACLVPVAPVFPIEVR